MDEAGRSLPSPTDILPKQPDRDQTKLWLAHAKAHAASLYQTPELVVTHGEGAWLTTSDGRRLLDFAGGMGVSVLGHRHPAILAALRVQADLLLHTSNALLSPPPIELSTRLAAISGGYQSFFVNSGAEAIEGALKLARQVAVNAGQPRPVFVACTNGFHGRTFGALSVTGQPKLQADFEPLLEQVRFVPFDDVPALAAALDAEVAAVVLEPIQGNGGVRVPAANYLREAQALCRRSGALFIADEVQTGIGRTGAWFASLEGGASPDIICLAKALGGGLPLGAVLAKPAVMGAFRIGSHGSTFGGNPLACRAALAVLDAIEQGGLLARGQAVGLALAGLCRGLPHVAAVRGRGLLLGLELTEGKSAASMRQACLEHDLLVTVAGPRVVRLFVPAIISDEELAEGCRRLRAAFLAA